jgi:hypothetical protein
MRDLLKDPAWSELVPAVDAFFETARPSEGSIRAARELAAVKPTHPSVGVALAEHRSPVELAMARLAGAVWLDDWVIDWRGVELEIDGSELIEAGVPEGPAVGRGLAAALQAKLDGEIATRDEELRVALAAAAAT